MKFTISYKFKLKMAQNLSGRSGPVAAGDAVIRLLREREVRIEDRISDLKMSGSIFLRLILHIALSRRSLLNCSVCFW